jgi:hypothetical protein
MGIHYNDITPVTSQHYIWRPITNKLCCLNADLVQKPYTKYMLTYSSFVRMLGRGFEPPPPPFYQQNTVTQPLVKTVYVQAATPSS